MVPRYGGPGVTRSVPDLNWVANEGSNPSLAAFRCAGGVVVRPEVAVERFDGDDQGAILLDAVEDACEQLALGDFRRDLFAKPVPCHVVEDVEIVEVLESGAKTRVHLVREPLHTRHGPSVIRAVGDHVRYQLTRH